MVCLDEYNNINDVLFLVGSKVYFDKEKLDLSNNEELDKDLFDYRIIVNNPKNTNTTYITKVLNFYFFIIIIFKCISNWMR